MKKLLLLFFIPMMLGCSSEENETSSIGQDPIIGTWKIIKMTEYPSNANPIITTYGECIQRSRVIFHSNGDIEDIFYRLNLNGICEEVIFDHQIEVNHTWTKLGENKYRFTQEKLVDGNRRIDTETPENIFFPDPNTMEIMEMGSNRPLDDPIKVEYYINSYQRVD